MRRRLPCTLLLLTLAAYGCDSPGTLDAGPTADAAPRDAGDAPCERDLDCSDDRFCNGAERCLPGDATADARGCVASSSPCLESQTCDDATRRCVTECASNGDADGDGHLAIECGGDDCDDSDGERFPGNTEICDDQDHDCDDRTLAGPNGDVDGDGYVSSACCVPDPFGAGPPICGRDCDDNASGVNPGTPESCNGVDDDCSGEADEGLLSVFYPDDDNDLFGRDEGAMSACARPQGFSVVGGDCDDGDRTVNPARIETCDGVDEDCDGDVDEEPDDLGTDDHCTACGELCSFGCTPGVGCATVSAVAVGTTSFGVASLDDGRFYGWGANPWGAFGRPIPTQSTAPIESGQFLPRFDSLFAGGGHVCSGGRCWGSNDHGQLGAGNASPSEAPSTSALLPLNGSVRASCGGQSHSCWQTEDRGTREFILFCAGANDSAQLGVAGAGDRTTPVEVAANGEALACGSGHTCATSRTGTYCWGANAFGQTGQALSETTPTPTFIDLQGGQIVAGADFTCLLANDSSGVWCWGHEVILAGAPGLPICLTEFDDQGQIDNEFRCSSSPIQIPSTTDAVQLTGGRNHVCVLRTSGEVACWGGGAAVTPTAIGGLDAVDEIHAGGGRTCALSHGRTRISCWGASQLTAQLLPPRLN